MNGSFEVTDDRLLQFYHLKTLNPQKSWKDDSTLVFQLEDNQWEQDNLETSFAVLNDLLQQEHEFNRKKGSENGLDRQDVMDPLNPTVSATELLKKLKIDQSSKGTYNYLITSKNFNPKVYLKNVHANDTFEQLTKSLDLLDKSLQDQSYELKQLIQTNFAKYVRSKSNLDHIYDRFDKLMGTNADVDDDELSVQKLNKSLNDTMKQTSLKLQPLLNNNDKSQKFQWTIQFINENRYFFDLPRTLKSLLLKKDYTNLMFEYERAKTTYEELSSRARKNSIGNGNSVVERIWSEVELIMDRYRKYCWAKLLEPPAIGTSDSQEVFLPLLSKLIDLKVTENPIIMWIDTRMNHLNDQLKKTSKQMLENIVASSSSLLENSSSDDIDLHFYLSMNIYSDDAFPNMKSNATPTHNHNLMVQRGLTDSPAVVETWLILMKFMSELGKISSSFVEFWEHVERFLDNTYQSTLLNERRKNNIIESNTEISADDGAMLSLSHEEINALKKQGSSFITSMAKVLSSLFRSTQSTLGDPSVSPSKDSGSPSSYGFIPPRSNCLSCLRYLPKIVDPIFRFTTELAQLSISTESIDSLRKLNAFIIDRSVSAISSTKLRDLSQMYVLEDWEIYESYDDGRYSITKFPEIARSLQQYSIQTVRDILFFYERLPVIKGISIVGYPSKQLLTGIEVQQIISMESILESVLKNAAKDKDNPRNAHTVLTLNNLKHIKSRTFPKILSHFDEAFEMNLSNKKLEIFNLLEKMESSIFGNYLSDLKFALRDILEERLNDINWSTYTSNSFRVGDYIIETLMVLINVHSECFRIGPQLIERILKETQIFISKYLFEAFKPYVGNISSDGLLQITVDLNFFNKVLKSLLVQETHTIVMACLQNCFQNDFSRMERVIKETEPIVNSNLDRTKVQFASLK